MYYRVICDAFHDFPIAGNDISLKSILFIKPITRTNFCYIEMYVFDLMRYCITV